VSAEGAVTDLGFDELLAGLHRVGAEAERRAQELDRLGLIPADLFDDLVDTGCFRAMLPQAHGGLELSLAQINGLIIEAAKANGSLGWILLIGIPAPLVFGLLPNETVTQLMADYPNYGAGGRSPPKARPFPSMAATG
jgi:indole-3-acetate monooxygenase